MNIVDVQNDIVTKFAKHAADIADGASYAYVNQMIEALKAKGQDPTQYEVAIVRDEFPQQTEDGMRIDYHIRLLPHCLPLEKRDD